MLTFPPSLSLPHLHTSSITSILCLHPSPPPPHLTPSLHPCLHPSPPPLTPHPSPYSQVVPEQLSYASVSSTDELVNVTQLGPEFRTSFVVRNSGPSTVPSVSLTISWPLNGMETGNNFYLYPTIISSTVSISDNGPFSSITNYDVIGSKVGII